MVSRGSRVTCSRVRRMGMVRRSLAVPRPFRFGMQQVVLVAVFVCVNVSMFVSMHMAVLMAVRMPMTARVTVAMDVSVSLTPVQVSLVV